MRTKPPCKSDGIDCPERSVGCHAGCEKWQEWQEIHEQEMTAKRKDFLRMRDVDTFMVNTNKRYDMARRRDYAREKRRKK